MKGGEKRGGMVEGGGGGEDRELAWKRRGMEGSDGWKGRKGSMLESERGNTE